MVRWVLVAWLVLAGLMAGALPLAAQGFTWPLRPGVTRPADPAPACAQPADAGALNAQVLAEVNRHRRAARLPVLTFDARLAQAARLVACDNAARNRLSHTTADGATLGVRLGRLGYPFRMANENLAFGPATGAAVVQGWMASPPHRANILAGASRQFGGGVARSAAGRLYWAMVTAAPR